MANFNFRLASDIDRDYSLFELMDENDNIIFDMGMSNEGTMEIVFHEVEGRIFDVLALEEYIQRGKKLIFDEMNSD